jgi:hypothetical protein
MAWDLPLFMDIREYVPPHIGTGRLDIDMVDGL